MTTTEEILVREGFMGPKASYMGEVGKIYIDLDLLHVPVIFAIHSDGALVIRFVMASLTGLQTLIKVLEIIKESYGNKIFDWVNLHFNIKANRVTEENSVVDGHWVSVKAGTRLNADAFQVIVTISPDQNPPKDVYPKISVG